MTEALHRRPGLQQRSVDRKMLRAQKPLHLRQAEERRQKPLRDLVGEQTVAVLVEGRSVEYLLVDRQPDEPAKQQVELQPFDQLPLRADRIEKLQQRRAQQSLGRDGRTAAPFVRRGKRPSVGPAPRSRAASIAADVFAGMRASMSTLGKQRPAHPIFAAHLANPQFASPTPANYATNLNSRPFPPDFFSSLLG